MGNGLSKPENSWAKNVAAKSGRGMHVTLSTRHGGKGSAYFNTALKMEQVLQELGCSVYNPNVRMPAAGEKEGGGGWSLDFDRSIDQSIRTKGFVFQLQENMEREISEWQQCEEWRAKKAAVAKVGAIFLYDDMPIKKPHDWDARCWAWKAIGLAKRQWAKGTTEEVEPLSAHDGPGIADPAWS